MILTLAIIVSTLSTFAGDKHVNQKVLNAFKTEFTTAKVWSGPLAPIITKPLLTIMENMCLPFTAKMEICWVLPAT